MGQRRRTLDHAPVVCIATLCSLYVAQGMPDGFVRIGLKTYLIDQGASTESIGRIVALVSWPWALKWMWGPIVDRFQHHRMGRRRPWILGAQLGIALTLGSMLLVPDLTTQLGILSVMILVANVFASLQDVSVDAMAIDQLPEEKRGIANGLMYGSSYVGAFVGSFLIGGLLLRGGLAAAISVQIVILFAIACFPLLFRETANDDFFSTRFRRSELNAEPSPTTRELFAKLGLAFSVRASWMAGVLALSSLVAVNAYAIVWPVYLQEKLGWSPQEYLDLEGGLSVWFGLGGAVLGGVIASRIGAKRAATTAIVLLAMTWFCHGLAADRWDQRAVVTSLFLAQTALTGFLQVSMFSMFMSIAWLPVAATQFTAYMAMLNLSNGLGARLAGTIESLGSMEQLFVVFGGYQLLGLVMLALIDPGQTRRVLSERATG